MEYYKIFYFRTDMSLDYAKIIFDNLNGDLFSPANVYNPILIKNHDDIKDDFRKKYLENNKFKDVFLNENYYTLNLEEMEKQNSNIIIKKLSFKNSIQRYFNVNKSDANNHKTRYEFEKK